MRIALLTFTLIALLIPAAAEASPRQVMTFEAPEELYDDTRRDATLDEIRAFGVTQIRQLVYWQQFAPSANRKRKPRFDASDPNAYPAFGLLDRVIAAAQARGIKVMLTPTGPVPRWATGSKKGNLNRPNAKQFGDFVTALARRYGAQVETWSVWNEPNQPQFLMPQYRKGKPASPRDLPQPLPRGAPRDPQRAREPARHDPDRRDVAARQRERAASADLPARSHLPELQVQEDAIVRAPGRRRLRPSRLYDAHRAALRAVRQERRHDRGAQPAGDGARQGRSCARPASAAEDLPDRVRDPVRAGPDLRRLVRAPAGLLRDRRAHGLRELARGAVLAVPDARRRPARGGLPVPRLRERPAPQQRPGASRPTARSRTRSPSSATARPTCCGA